MKTLVYFFGLLYFMLQGVRQSGPIESIILNDTIPVRDTVPGIQISKDSLIYLTDHIPGTDSLSWTDSLKPIGKPIKGVASFYSAKFNGRKAANGSIFSNTEMTAASNNFKLNTLVRVTNLRNNKSVIVLITDRMHSRMKKKGRVVDLTRNAAKQLDFIQRGLVKVSVQPVVPLSEN